jgi:hypothetical protein
MGKRYVLKKYILGLAALALLLVMGCSMKDDVVSSAPAPAVSSVAATSSEAEASSEVKNARGTEFEPVPDQTDDDFVDYEPTETEDDNTGIYEYDNNEYYDED